MRSLVTWVLVSVFLVAPSLHANNGVSLLDQGAGKAVVSNVNSQDPIQGQSNPFQQTVSNGNGGSFIQRLMGGIMQLFNGRPGGNGGFMGIISRLLGSFGINFGTRWNGIGNTVRPTNGPTNTGVNNGPINGSNVGTAPNGVLNLPIMRQGAGGSEAAKRGCGPTSLLMAIGCNDPSKIQGVLEQVCDRPGGLRYGDGVKWLHQQGYTGSKQYNNWTVQKLQQATMVNKTPVICSIKNPRTGNGHIVVVTGVTSEGVHINDPGPGKRKVVPFNEWNAIWKHRNQLAIVVSK